MPRYFHYSPYEFQPGDHILPAAQTGRQSDSGYLDHYDANKVFMFDDGHLNEPYDLPADYLEWHRYEVEPHGRVEPDAEAAAIRQKWEQRHGHPFNDQGDYGWRGSGWVPDCSACQREDENGYMGPEWYHPYAWQADSATVMGREEGDPEAIRDHLDFLRNRQSNILDPIHDMLDVRVWDNPGDPEPRLKPIHRDWITQTIYEVLDKHGYDGMENWLTLALTGSLTTYQYSEESDCDISLFVNTDAFPDWSRAEMIGIMISEFDTVLLPGTPHPMQCFVVSRRFAKEDLYKPGLRSAYDLETDQWIVPPERSRVHDVEREENEAYTVALESADKMEKLLRYEADKAVTYWHQIHKRRMRDMNKGKGDYAPSNIVYKMLNNRGLFPRIEEASGEHIA